MSLTTDPKFEYERNFTHSKAVGAASMLFMIVCVASTICTPSTSAAPYRLYKPPITMGGFKEDPAPDETDTDPIQYRENYLKNKAELERAIGICDAEKEACDANVRIFALMIKRVEQIRDKLTQAKMINAWINIYITYDEIEAANAHSNLEHRSLIQALNDREGICDEIALLKLFALEKLGYASDDVRWVGENDYLNGKEIESGHAVVEVRIRRHTWALNDQTMDKEKGEISSQVVQQYIRTAAMLEPTAVHLNFSKNSHWLRSDEFFLPCIEFNSAQYTFYISDDPKADLSNIPKIALKARKRQSTIDHFMATHPFETSLLMASAFTGRYEVSDLKTYQADAFAPAIPIKKRFRFSSQVRMHGPQH